MGRPIAPRPDFFDAPARRGEAVRRPGKDDSVGLDLTESNSRFGMVVDLDCDPRLRVEPEHADLPDIEEGMFVLEQVGALWCRTDPRAEVLRPRR